MEQPPPTYLIHAGMSGPIEARVTAPEGEPGQGGKQAALSHAWYTLGYHDLWGEQRMGEDTALTYSAVWGCVRVISEALASLGWHVYERQADGRTRLPIEDDIAWVLDLQANPEMSALDFRQKMLKDALLGGNAYAEIERDGMGRPRWLWPLDRQRVTPERMGGQLVYEIKNGAGRRDTVLPARDVFHLRGMSDDGIVGYGVVSMARRTIQLGLSEEQFGATFYGKGPMPGGVLEIPGNLASEAKEKLQKDVERLYGGSKNAGKVLVLTGGQKFTKLDISNADAEFLASRKFQITEVCRWFGVPPHKLADLDRATFSNIEEQEIAFVVDCLMAWARRLESEADIKLFGQINKGRRYTKLNLGARLRGNSQTQTSTVTQKVTSGIMTVNEGRDYFDLNPVDGGDTPLIQGAMVPLERILEEPEPPEPPAPPPSTDQQQSGEDPAEETPATDPADLTRIFGGLLEDAFGRLLRVESDKAKRAHNKGQLAEHVRTYYTDESQENVAKILLPIYEALAIVMGRPIAEATDWAARVARDHVSRSRSELSSHGAGVDWSDRSWLQAEQSLKGIFR